MWYIFNMVIVFFEFNHFPMNCSWPYGPLYLCPFSMNDLPQQYMQGEKYPQKSGNRHHHFTISPFAASAHSAVLHATKFYPGTARSMYFAWELQTALPQEVHATAPAQLGQNLTSPLQVVWASMVHPFISHCLPWIDWTFLAFTVKQAQKHGARRNLLQVPQSFGIMAYAGFYHLGASGAAAYCCITIGAGAIIIFETVF